MSLNTTGDVMIRVFKELNCFFCEGHEYLTTDESEIRRHLRAQHKGQKEEAAFQSLGYMEVEVDKEIPEADVNDSHNTVSAWAIPASTTPGPAPLPAPLPAPAALATPASVPATTPASAPAVMTTPTPVSTAASAVCAASTSTSSTNHLNVRSNKIGVNRSGTNHLALGGWYFCPSHANLKASSFFLNSDLYELTRHYAKHHPQGETRPAKGSVELKAHTLTNDEAITKFGQEFIDKKYEKADARIKKHLKGEPVKIQKKRKSEDTAEDSDGSMGDAIMTG